MFSYDLKAFYGADKEGSDFCMVRLMSKGIQENPNDIGRSSHRGGPYTWKTFTVVHS